jgi:hypothetical protein
LSELKAAIKDIEANFGVETRAFKDDMTIIGDPDTFFGPSGFLESLLALLEKVGL